MAKCLGAAGKRVLVLEAGDTMAPNINTYMSRFYNSWIKVPESAYTPDVFADPGTLNVGRPTSLTLTAATWQNPKKSYLIQLGPKPFGSTYERIAGGTALHWLGTCLRLLPSDFRMASTYQRFGDWPITYTDLERWYREAEAELGVSANRAHQDYLGVTFESGYEYPMPEIPRSFSDTTVAEGIDGMILDGVHLKNDSIRCTPAARNSLPYQSRRVCAGNTNCIPICPIGAKYDPTVTLSAAQSNGNVEICYRTVASSLTVDGAGRVSHVEYLQYDDLTGRHTPAASVSGTIVIVAANAIETPRLLMMSTNGGRTRDGVANGSTMLGKNLMDHPFYVPWGLLPKPVYPYRGPLSTAGIEDLRDGPFRKDRGAYRVELGNEGWNFAIGGDPNVTTVDFINGLNKSLTNRKNEALFGAALVDRLNDRITRQFRLGFLVEQEPEGRNCVTLSKRECDHLGLPRPAISYDLSPYTQMGLLAAKKAADAIFAKLGAEQFTQPPGDDNPAVIEVEGVRIAYMGAGHIMGTYRMGSDQHHSVVNSDQRSWEHDNLFLIGSGVFPTSGTANPTLTIAALALRTANTILSRHLI